MGDSGALSAYLDREGMSRCPVYSGYLLTGLVYYALYLASERLFTMMTFQTGSYSGEINQAYFFYINMLELTSFIFLRTRSSIKYYPKIITLANLSFLYYINSTMYAA